MNSCRRKTRTLIHPYAWHLSEIGCSLVRSPLAFKSRLFTFAWQLLHWLGVRFIRSFKPSFNLINFDATWSSSILVNIWIVSHRSRSGAYLFFSVSPRKMLRFIKPFSFGFRRALSVAANTKPRVDTIEGVAPPPLTQLNEDELALKETGNIILFIRR